ncbi:MAG: hypothetical protein L3J32_06620 [Rhizobiaceae bacterium]|nr:hypothetical protein [Rhizobiaceae bacterium]
MTYHPIKLSLIAVTALVGVATAAQAGGHRPDTRYMSCSSAVSLVQSRGAVILSTGRFTYDKFVKNHAYCNINEDIIRAFVPTTDTNRCNVGFICKDKYRLSD